MKAKKTGAVCPDCYKKGETNYMLEAYDKLKLGDIDICCLVMHYCPKCNYMGLHSEE